MAPTMSDRVAIYTSWLLASGRERLALERFVLARVPALDAGRIARASAELARCDLDGCAGCPVCATERRGD